MFEAWRPNGSGYRVGVFPTGLSMLWEKADAPDALQTRFGFTDVDEVGTWLTALLYRRWGLTVTQCDRVVISDINAIAWLQTDAGPFVVKVCAHPPVFERLATIADILASLDAIGLPVAAPLPSRQGQMRVVHDEPQPLSVVVQPAVEGDLLDTNDATAVRAAGAVLARLHTAMAALPAGALATNPRNPEPNLRRRLSKASRDHAIARAPQAAARLEHLLTHLPDVDTPPQLIHNDYRGANILTSGSDVTAVLDFDEMALDHRVYDLANAAVLLATRFTTWRPASPAAREHLLAGYRSRAKLTAIEESWLEAVILWLGLQSIPAGGDPDGWAEAVEHGR